ICSIITVFYSPFPTRRSSDLVYVKCLHSNRRQCIVLSRIGVSRLASVTFKCKDGRVGPNWNVIVSSFDWLARQFDEGAIKSTERSEEHTSELQSRFDLVCRLL